MIVLTKLNKAVFVVNCDLIETIEETPDTLITLSNGKLLLVEERAEQVVEKIIAYRKRLRSLD